MFCNLKLREITRCLYLKYCQFSSNRFARTEQFKLRNFTNATLSDNTTVNVNANLIPLVRKHNLYFRNEFSSRWRYIPKFTSKVVLFAGLLNILGLKDNEEQESVLIMTMKRAVLLIQKEDYKKAEQMLHVALKIAQDEQNRDAITYIFDLLANLAFEQGEIEKAEKLFVSVMQRLLSAGVTQDDNKIIHMSLKLANIYITKKDYKRADDGFKFCTEGLQKKVEKGVNDEDTLLLLAMTYDWYARFLLDVNRTDEAFQCFEKAYDLSLKLNGTVHEQNVILLNDLGTVCCLKGDNEGALKYLKEAIEIGKQVPLMEDLGSVYVNLGNVYMKHRMYLESKKCCEEGWKNGKRHNNKEILAEANKCLDELKLLLG